MSGYLIYLPERRGASPAMLDEFNLSDLCTDSMPSMMDVLENGPDEGSGVVLGWTLDNPRHGVFANQTWKKAPGQSWWLGWETDRPPTPQGLLRKEPQSGRDIILGDGNAWHIPIARQLPMLLGLDDRGEMTSRIVDRYRDFWDGTWRWIDWFKEGTWPFRQGFDYVAQAIGINYRVNREIVSLLNLVDTSLVLKIVAITADMETDQKKTSDT